MAALIIMIRYLGYCYVIDYLKNCKEKYTLNRAYDLIKEYVSEIFRLSDDMERGD